MGRRAVSLLWASEALLVENEQSACMCGVQTVKSLSAVQETWVQSLGREDPPEKGMATHSSILAWRISRTEGPAEHVPHNMSLMQWELLYRVEARFTLVLLLTALAVSGALISGILDHFGAWNS